MPLEIPVVWTDAHRLHDPDAGIWIGVRIPADELPERAEAIRSALEGAAASDSQAPLAASESGYREAGRRLCNLRLPTVLVQEGGYDLAAIGALVLAALECFEETRG
jgi:hypothetical protein